METDLSSAPDAKLQMLRFHDRHCKYHYGLKLLDRIHTIELLSYAHDKNLTLWGIDAIILHLDYNNAVISTQPDMAHDFDFSRQTVPEAISVLETLDDSYHFEFVDWIGLPGNASE